MLKTNSKKAIEKLRAYIVDNFNFTDYGPKSQKPKSFHEIANFIYNVFINEKYKGAENYYKNYRMQDIFEDWCKGLPSILDTCYYYNRSAVDDLAYILEESDEEKTLYSESEAEHLLTALIWIQISKEHRK